MPDTDFAELVSERLVLRRFRPADLDTLVSYRSVPAVARFQGWDAPFSLVEGENLIRGTINRDPDTPGEWFQFAVTLRSTGELIGDFGAKTQADDPRQAEIGYTIAPAYQGRGYATEAARALLHYLFGERGMHRVTASCDPRNAASARLLERLGMRLEGHLVESTWSKGEWTDDLIYAVLEREWSQRR